MTRSGRYWKFDRKRITSPGATRTSVPELPPLEVPDSGSITATVAGGIDCEIRTPAIPSPPRVRRGEQAEGGDRRTESHARDKQSSDAWLPGRETADSSARPKRRVRGHPSSLHWQTPFESTALCEHEPGDRHLPWYFKWRARALRFPRW
jgi:hypothetical protein